MKKLLFAIILCAGFAASAFGQSSPPWTIQEIDGSPRVNSPTLIKITNGALSCSGKTCTITVTGGSGSPGGASGTVQWNDSGAFNGTSGLTATATTITIVNGVTATFSRAGVLYTGTVTTDNSSVQTMLLQGDRATVASNDEAYVTYRLSNAAGTQTEVGRLTWAIPDPTAGAEYGRLDFSVMGNSSLAKELQLSSDDLSPAASDGLALGTVSLPWSDIFLATGAVIDFANNDSRITHSSGVLTISAGDLRVTTAGTNAASVATLNGTQSFQSKTITNSNNVLGGVTMTLGSDADGDTYYRASNVLTRLAKGTAGQVLTMNAGATAPEWAAAAGGSGITIGTTTVTSGTGGRLIYETSGNVVGEISGATSNGTNVTFGSGNLLATSPVFTTDITTPIVKSAAGADLAANATAPAATTGASQAGKAVSITASAAVASTDTAGAAAGGSVTITAGAAARLTSGNANGGNITLTRGAGIGTGTTGQVLIGGGDGSITVPVLANAADTDTGFYFPGTAQVSIISNGTTSTTHSNTSFSVNVPQFNLGSGNAPMTAPASGTHQLGIADAASPVARTLQVQSVSAGTADTNGAAWTFAGSRSTGTGAGGSLIFQTSPAAGSTATTQNALVTALTIDSKAHVIHGGSAPAVSGSCGTSPSVAGTDSAGKLTTGTVAPTSCTLTFSKAWGTAPSCFAQNETTANLVKAISTTTTVILSGTFVASDVLSYACIGY
jgi:hypothetical protein